ncbi:MAG: hypothetical protein KA116_04420 [Proteobacteria bacterium]|nr:hypothetical protein [Pseudomonadota bacterium]
MNSTSLPPIAVNPYALAVMGLASVGAVVYGTMSPSNAAQWEDGVQDIGLSRREAPSNPGSSQGTPSPLSKLILPLTMVETLIHDSNNNKETPLPKFLEDLVGTSSTKAATGAVAVLELGSVFFELANTINNTLVSPKIEIGEQTQGSSSTNLKQEDLFPKIKIGEREKLWDLWLRGNYQNLDPQPIVKEYPSTFMYSGPSAAQLTYNYNSLKRYGDASRFNGFDPRAIRDASLKKNIELRREQLKKFTSTLNIEFKNSLYSDAATFSEIIDQDLKIHADVYGSEWVEKAKGWLRPTPIPQTVDVETALKVLDPLWTARDNNQIHIEIEAIAELLKKTQRWKLDPEMKDLGRYVEKEVKRAFIDPKGWQQNLPQFSWPAPILDSKESMNIDAFRALNHILTFKVTYELSFSAFLSTQALKLTKNEIEYALMLKRAIQILSMDWMKRWDSYRNNERSLNLDQEAQRISDLINAEQKILTQPKDFLKNSEELVRDLIKKTEADFLVWKQLNVESLPADEPLVEDLPDHIIGISEIAIMDFIASMGRGPMDNDFSYGNQPKITPQLDPKKDEEEKEKESLDCDSESAKRSFAFFLKPIVHNSTGVVKKYFPHFQFIKLWTAKRANARYREKFGYHHNPVKKFSCATEVAVIQSFRFGIFERLSSSLNRVGAWFYDKRDFSGYSLAQIEKKLSLFERPELLSSVAPSAGADLLYSTAEAFKGPGSGGGRQFSYWMTRPNASDFREARTLKP